MRCQIKNVHLGWYSEINEILQNLSDVMFMECVIYLHSVSMDYFNVIHNKIDILDISVLEVRK